jgi:hypothetical protein
MDLKKKIGPLPLWAWVLILGTAGGLLWYEHDKSSSASSASSQVDPATGLTYAQEQQESEEGIDPLTGEDYSQEQYGSSTDPGAGDYGGGTGLTDASTNSTPETPDQEISDVVGWIGDLQAAGLIPAAQTAPTATATDSGSDTGLVAGTVKTFTDKLAGGIVVTNKKPPSSKKYTVKSIAGNLFEEIPLQTATKTTSTTTSGGGKTKVTTGSSKSKPKPKPKPAQPVITTAERQAFE